MEISNNSTALNNISKIGFGGGCHWCTEAVFQKLKGVQKLEQGWISSEVPNDVLSEAVIVHYDENIIDLAILVAIHLHTHSCTSEHSLRTKYRSAIYFFEKSHKKTVQKAIIILQRDFDKPILVKVLPFISFKENKEEYQNYYLKHPESQFCTRYIHPKFKLLMNKFSNHLK